MKQKLLYDIAFALLMARWKQTLVAAVGVTFSIMMFIALLSFMSGLNHLLDGLIINRTPHIRLYNEIKASENQPITLFSEHKNQHNFIHSVKPTNKSSQIYNSGAIMASIRKDPRVFGVAPKIIAPVFYNVGTVNLPGIINGIEVEEENKLFLFKDYIIQGDYAKLRYIPNSIILGKGVAETILVNVGDVIQITTSKGEQIPLKVVGLFQIGIVEIDKVWSYTSIATAQKLMGESNNYITDIQVKLNDILVAPKIAKEYQKRYELEAVDIQTANSQFETGSSIRSIISYAVGITLLIVAGFGIYNILNMMIYEKMDSIAIMKATGFAGKDVRRIFIAIALSIGVFGGLLGLILGFGLSAFIGHIPFRTESLPTVKTYPINYNPLIYVIGAVFSIITTYLAGYFPARKASKVDPVIIIRGS